MAAVAQHWLTRVAAQAGLPAGAALSMPPRLPRDEAWRTVASVCGVTEADLVPHVAAAYRVGAANLDAVEPAALKLVPESLARRFHVLPLADVRNRLTVATCDPTDLAAEQALAFASGRRVVFAIAPPAALREAIAAHYAPGKLAEQTLAGLPSQLADAVRVVEEAKPEDVALPEVDQTPIVKLTNLILHDAIQAGASDVHIEPELKDGAVRFRVDGVLRGYMQIPRPVLDRVISRLKVMGNMDVSDRLRPHAGRSHVQVGGTDYDLRLSTVPTRQSEKAVIRILGPSRARALSSTGVPDEELGRLRQLFESRDGIVVVTGPTGSGKTTTLYAALQELATGQINVMTVEDPVEYELAGITQIQVAARQGLTFAAALRTILRQDPDVILVGEIRDLETAEIAVQASMTGHLVLTTLHTNDAVGVLGRLAGLGVSRANIASTLRGVVAQRLVRKLCQSCRTPITGALTPEEQRLADRYGTRPTARAAGCEQCAGTGYRDRMPILEILVNTPAIEELIVSGAPALTIRRRAEQAGMVSLAGWGLRRAAKGETTLQEVERVLGIAATDDPAAEEPRADRTGEAPAPLAAHILSVCGDRETRDEVRAILEQDGYRVSEAIDLSTAWQRLASGDDFSLVLLEFDTVFDGRDLLIRMRGLPATAGLPVVAITRQNRHLDANLMEEGVDDCVHKPIDSRALRTRLRASLRRRHPDEDPEAPGGLTGLVASSEPSIAVLPFADMSQGQDQAYLCDGLAEELTHALSRMGGLRVAARTSSTRLRGMTGDVRDIGQQLGVAAVLEGSVRKSGDRLRITARLVTVDDGCELMSERYEREMTDVFALQDDIAQTVCEKLRVVLFGIPQPARGPVSHDSAVGHDFYLQGRYAWNRRTEDGLRQSVALFGKAVAREPAHAAAHAGLADAYLTLAIYGAMPPAEAMPKAQEAADRALAIDGTLAEALVARSLVRAMYMWDWTAEDGFRQALEVDPDNPRVHHWYAANFLMPLGRFDEARLHLERAATLDPLSSPIRATRGVLAYFERQHEEAVERLRALVASDSGFGVAHYFLGQALTELGRHDEALAALEKARALDATPEAEGARGYALARAGRNDEAREVLAHLTRLAGSRYVSPVLLAQVAAAIGDADTAFAHLEEAFRVRATDLVWLVVRPAFDVVRDDGRLGGLASRVLG